MTELPHVEAPDPLAREPRGTWERPPVEGAAVLVRCPFCGAHASVQPSDVFPDGRVLDPVECPEHCGFYGLVRLQEWSA